MGGTEAEAHVEIQLLSRTGGGGEEEPLRTTLAAREFGGGMGAALTARECGMGASLFKHMPLTLDAREERSWLDAGDESELVQQGGEADLVRLDLIRTGLSNAGLRGVDLDIESRSREASRCARGVEYSTTISANVNAHSAVASAHISDKFVALLL